MPRSELDSVFQGPRDSKNYIILLWMKYYYFQMVLDSVDFFLMFFLVDFFLVFFRIFMFSVCWLNWKGRSVSGSNLIWSLYSGPPAFELSQAQPSGIEAVSSSHYSWHLGVPMCPLNFLWDVVGDGCELGEVGSEGSANVWRESYWLLELGISTTEKDARSETMEAFGHSY